MKWLCLSALLLVPTFALADVCQVLVNATDLMRFEQQELNVEPRCTEVEVTLHHTGKLPANAMGHDWVLTRTADVTAVANAGMSAGLANNYQKPGDTRIVAATKVIGGGESTTVHFSTSLLQAGTSYSYFCSAPGHYSIMKGRFVYNQSANPTVAQNSTK